MDSFDIYVPYFAEAAGLCVDARSAIVGSPALQWLEDRAARVEQRESRVIDPADDHDLILDFEGNRYNAANMVTFADRCVHAAGRHRDHYPTVARRLVRADRVMLVASFDLAREQVQVDTAAGHRALLWWLEVDAEQLVDELVGTSIRAQRA